MEDRRTKLFKGLNFQKEQYLKLLEKYERLQDERRKQRYDILYTVYGLFLDCLEYPGRTRMQHIEKFIIACKSDLKEEDLEELRNVRKMILNDLEVAIKTVFPCARKLDKEPKQQFTQNTKVQEDSSILIDFGNVAGQKVV